MTAKRPRLCVAFVWETVVFSPRARIDTALVKIGVACLQSHLCIRYHGLGACIMLEYIGTLNLRLETIPYYTHFFFFDNKRFGPAFDGVLTRKMPKESQAERPKTDWSIFVQQPDTQVNSAHANSTKEQIKHVEPNFQK